MNSLLARATMAVAVAAALVRPASGQTDALSDALHESLTIRAQSPFGISSAAQPVAGFGNAGQVFRPAASFNSGMPPLLAPGPTAAASPNEPYTGTWNAFAPPLDPFLPGPTNPGTGFEGALGPQMAPGGPFPGSGGAMNIYGANGPQPYRFGWSQDYSMTYLAGAETDFGTEMETLGIDVDYRYAQPAAGWISAISPQFGVRFWDSPSGANLPDSVFRVGLDLEASTPQNGPYSYVLGFTPSINSDFEGSITSRAWNFDGRAAVFQQLNPFWRAALGVMYWDRVEDRILPWAGFIFSSDRWEMRLMFPESRISYFYGNELGCAKWLYLRAEYHVEAYEIQRGGTAAQVELEDYRVLFGSRMDAGTWNWFVEGGIVFGRDVAFANTSGFDITAGAIFRAGLRF